ncbi:MAG: 50S ribosomal protein L11 methyltransferase [Alicyclobacillus sp.]|nr:50S ribosomal protein L11 methyltransferase [Alicyclobacillus sp.]
MQWVEVTCTVLHEASEALCAVLLEWPDVQGVAVEGVASLQPPHPEYGEWFDESLLATDTVQVRFYLPHPATVQTAVDRARRALAQVQAAGLDIGRPSAADADVRAEVVDEESWASAWKESYDPIPVGRRFLIVPAWRVDDIEGLADGRVPVVLEPGMAFGTGTHATTQLCLRTLESLVTPGMRVLDVGTGTGILAIASARLGAQVTALDLDPVAVRAAEDNVQRNDLLRTVTVQEGNLLAPVEEAAGLAPGPFDVVVANILRDAVLQLAPIVARRLRAGGHFIASGFVTAHADAVARALGDGGYRVVQTLAQEDWAVVVAERLP